MLTPPATTQRQTQEFLRQKPSTEFFQKLDLSRISDKEILYRMEKLVQYDRKQTHIFLWHLNEVEIRQLYFEVGCTSLFDYLNNHYGYSESSAYEKQNAVRLLRRNPEITPLLESGKVNISQLSQIEADIKREKKRKKFKDKLEEKQITQELIDQVQNKTMKETRQIIATELDLPVKLAPKQTPQKDQSIRIEVTLTKEQDEVFRFAQSLFSHCVPDLDLAESITFLAKAFVQKKLGKDGLEHWQNSKKKASELK